MKKILKKLLWKETFLKTSCLFFSMLFTLGFTSLASGMQPLGGTTKLSAGEWHTCAVGSAGEVKCWGYGWEGSLGTGAAQDLPYAASVIGLGEAAVNVSVGVFHSCALTASGAVKCWGSNLHSESGGAGFASLLPNTISGLGSGALAVATRHTHSCAVTAAGGVKCWGDNQYGQLGGGGVSTPQAVPVDVVGLATGATGVATSEFSSCAISAGKVKCWGSLSLSNLAPEEVAGLSGITQIVGGMNHFCALTAAGGVKCWGGLPGDGSTASSSPVSVTGLNSGVALLAAGLHHTCAITQGGATWCWGKNDWGQLGDGTLQDRLQPVNVTANVGALAAIGAGNGHSCGAAANGDTRCWGTFLYGRLGNNMSDDFHVQPVDVAGLGSGVAQVSAGSNFTCARTAAGGAKCWGANEFGYLGDGTTAMRGAPVDVTGLTSGVLSVGSGIYHTCAVLSGGGVKCWGLNLYGALGNGVSVGVNSVPVDVAGLGAAATAVTAGMYFSCAIVTGGGVKCWGRNDQGQLGNNSPNDSTSPVDVIGLDGPAVGIAAGVAHVCAVTSTGRAQCWGQNDFGQLGDGTRVKRLTATTVSGLASGIVAITSHQSTSCALSTGGAMKCWGANWIGQLGDGTSFSVRDLPSQVSGLTSGVQSMGAGVENTCAVMTSGQLKCWGSNLYGVLGLPLGTPSYSNTPLNVPDQPSVSAVSIGQSHGCSIFPGGAVKCWGTNEYGALGSGILPLSFTPVSVLTYDTTPNAFSFAPKQNVAPATSQVSAPANITGLEAAAPISVSGGEYSIGCGVTYTNAPGLIAPDTSVCVRHVSAAAPSASVVTTLRIGGVTAAFTSTTSAGNSVASRWDFNGDNKPDILWRNAASGALYLWYMNGPALISDQLVTSVDPSWKLDGVADFNGDGHPDIVWRNGAGDTYVWYLVNGVFQSDAFLFSLPPEWVIQGVADFNADGKPDFLMRNTNSGNAFVWFFNNNVATGDQFLFNIDPSWKVEGVEDLNADGQPDLLFRNMTSGLAFAWNTQFAAGSLSLGTSSPPIFGIDPVWEIVQMADWNADGKPDLLFRNKNSGVVFVWYMNGTTLTTSDFITQIDPSWEIVPRR